MFRFLFASLKQLLLVTLVVQHIHNMRLTNHISIAAKLFLICSFTFQDSVPCSKTGSLYHWGRLHVTLQDSLKVEER